MVRLTLILATLPFLPLIWLAYPSFSQPIIPATDGTNTNVNAIGNRLDITGGQLSGDRANLFHSFQQFGLSNNQIANFLSNPSIQNILGRVVGGDASVINGLIQVTGGNSNLFLMNPAGIIFGNNASLNVAGSFTATTANGIGFGNNFFNAIGTNNYQALVGNPNSFAFTMSQPGAIISAADLAVSTGKDINFLGGTVISTGTLTAPDGRISLTTVAGESLVRLSQTGDVIGLEFQPNPSLGVNPWGLSILTLPQLLTGANLEKATGLKVNPNGEVVLTAANLPVNTGDTIVNGINAGSSNLTASNNLTLVNSTLQTSQNLSLLAANTVTIRDSANNPFIVKAGTKLSIQGNSVDIFALNNSASGLFSGTDMILKSANPINGDARYFAGGNFRIEKLDGSLGSLVSLFDPVIRSDNDVSLANYTGASLQILAGGQVTIPGDIRITGVDTTDFISETFTLSDGISTVSVNGSTQPTLDIRAGVTPISVGSPTSANINIGNVAIALPNSKVVITNQYRPNTALAGNIQTGNIDTRTLSGDSGSVTIDSRGSINTGNILTSAILGTSGDVKAIAQGNISTGAVNTTSTTTANSGNIALSSINGGLTAAIVDASSRTTLGNTGNGGNIALNVARDITVTNGIFTDAFTSDNSGNSVVGNGGNISIISNTGNITATNLRSGSVIQGNGTTKNAGSISVTTLGNINVGDVTSNSEIKGTNSTGTTGNGANITLKGNNITTLDIGTLSVISDGGGNGNAGKGGDIQVDATGNISARRISSTSAIAQGNASTGGNISVNTSNGNINILADVTSASATFGGNANDAGNINFSTLNGNINVGLGILAPSFSQSGTAGNGGNITLTTGGTNSRIAIGTLIAPIPNLSGSLIASSFNSPNPKSGGKITLTTDRTGFTGTTTFAGNVSTNADIDFGTSLVLPTNSNITIRSGGGNINFVRFNSQLDGAANVILAAGNISFNGDVGSITPLSSLTVNADSTRLPSKINTTGNINFNSSIRGGTSEINSANGAIAIAGDINARILSLSASQNVTFTNIFSEGRVNLTSVNGGITGTSIDTTKIEGNVGGDITIKANNDISFTGDIRTSQNTFSIFADSSYIAGDVSISSTNGKVSTRNINTNIAAIGVGKSTDGRNISIVAKGDVTTGILNSSSAATGIESNRFDAGNGGTININTSGNITTDGILAFSLSNNGNAGSGGSLSFSGNALVLKNLNTSAISTGASTNVFGSITTGNGGNVTIAATSNILTGDINSSSRINNPNLNSFAGRGGVVNFSATQNISTGLIDTSSQVFVDSGSAIAQTGGNVFLTAGGNISSGAIATISFASSQLATIDSGEILSSVASNGAGNVAINAGNAVNIGGDISTNSGFFLRGNLASPSNLGGKISITSGSDVTVGGSLFSAARQAGDITVGAVGNILIGSDVSAFSQVGLDGLGAITQKGGDITLTSRSGNINIGRNVGAFSSASSTTSLLTQSGDGGNINIQALGNIAIAGNLDTFSVARNSNSTATTGNGGDITLISSGNSSSISTKDITTTSITKNGGRVGLLAQNTITTGRINTSSVNGNGGTVFIDPSGLTQVTSINAQGGRNGVGGEILVNLGLLGFNSFGGEFLNNFAGNNFGLFRATGSFTALNGIDASISNQGGLGGAPITIRHGGKGIIPFLVGQSEFANGTRAAITNSATNTIASGSFPFTFTQGNPLISLISVERPPIIIERELIPPAASPPIGVAPVAPQSVSILTKDLVQTTAQQVLQDLGSATGKKPAIIKVQFTPTGDRLILVLSTGKNKIVKSLPITRQQVIDQADNLSLQVSTVPLGRNNPNDYLPPAQKLYQWLVAPMDAELKAQEIDTVMFEMPEGLRDRPVAAFHDGKKFMVEKYSLGLIPNLNLVDTRYRNLRQVQALVMGASEFNNPNLKPLPAVPLEVKAVGDNWNSVTFLNQNFNLGNLTTLRNQTPYGIIHLATHAEFVAGGDSYIQLWGDEKLRPEQIRNLGWKDVELLVLSACKTATGDRIDELGFAGLAFQSGVKSILASLWQVSDEGTLSLMSEFYKQMNRPEVTIKAEGLRQAQLSMLNKDLTLKDGAIRSSRGTSISLPATLPINRDLSHPFYWAGFTIVGSPW